MHLRYSVLLLFLFITIVPAQQSALKPEQVLVSGPHTVTMPATEEPQEVKEAVASIIEFKSINTKSWQPAVSATEDADGLQWQELELQSTGFELPVREDTEAAELWFLSFYVKTDRFIEAELSATACLPFKVIIDGEETGKNLSVLAAEQDCSPTTVDTELTLETGVHLVVIKTVTHPGLNKDVSFNVQLKSEGEPAESVELTTDPERFASVERLLDDPKITGVGVSAEGDYSSVSYKQYNYDSGKDDYWVNIYSTTDGSMLRTLRGSEYTSFTWLPFGNGYFYEVKAGGKTEVWTVDLEAGSTEKVLDGIENLTSVNWAPTGEYLVYGISERSENTFGGLTRIAAPYDRLPSSRYNQQLYLYNVNTGIHKQLTEYNESASVLDFCPRGNEVFYSITTYDYTRRPYQFTTVYKHHIASGRTKKVFTEPWVQAVDYSPHGRVLAVVGGQSTFGDIDRVVPDDVIPNDYDGMLYLYDAKSDSVIVPLPDFAPSIEDIDWSTEDGIINIQVTERYYRYLYRYNPETNEFGKLPLKISLLDGMAISKDGNVICYYGTTSTSPQASFLYKRDEQRHLPLHNTNLEPFKNINPGKTETFDFTKEDGTVIEGFVYLPTNFDPDKKYPLIVYYYGGTSPVTVEYEGRYPKNIWAANGYVVYILQPSGAVGYGKEFSARHVNDWGKTTAEEIIQGTEKFLEAHSFVDPERVGCIGASYGGFMTMNVLTKTDIFKTGIAHAGISALTSYWGEGYWGVDYSATATAESFPWNRKDIYVDQSPIYSADKVNASLLLLHGSADTNVPPGESRQFFAALTVLGKDVELIEVEGLDHHIMEHDKRERWTKTIIAWFDKELKGQPAWWNHLYSR